MGWIYLDDHFDEHPKVVNLNPAAFRLYVVGLGYCSRQLTNGDIPKRVVSLLYRSHNYLRSVSELVDKRLWDVVDSETYHVHDYEQWNKKQHERRLKAKHAAQSRWKGQNGDAPSIAQPHAQPDATEHMLGATPSNALEPRNHRTKEQQHGFTITKDGVVDHPGAAASATQSLRTQLIATIATRRVIATQPTNVEAYKAVVTKALQVETLERLQELANQPAHKPREPNEAARRDYDRQRPNCTTCEGSGWTTQQNGTVKQCNHHEPEPF